MITLDIQEIQKKSFPIGIPCSSLTVWSNWNR